MEVLEYGKRDFSEIYKRKNCCYGIVEKDDNILLIFSSKDGDYSLPGGSIQGEEEPEETIHREFFDEAGLTITEKREIVATHSFVKGKSNSSYYEKYDRYFIVDVDEKSKTNPLESWHERVWFKKEDASNALTAPYQKLALEYYLKNYSQCSSK